MVADTKLYLIDNGVTDHEGFLGVGPFLHDGSADSPNLTSCSCASTCSFDDRCCSCHPHSCHILFFTK